MLRYIILCEFSFSCRDGLAPATVLYRYARYLMFAHSRSHDKLHELFRRLSYFIARPASLLPDLVLKLGKVS